MPKKEELGIEKTCQKCLKRRPTTYRRELYAKHYVGGCGDSFCWAGCDSTSCKPFTLTICDACAKLMGTPNPPPRKTA